MLDLDKALDKDPTKENISDFISSEIENKQIFKELQTYNDSGRFVYIHPLTKALEETDRLRALKKADPAAFASELVNADKSITRYNSQIKHNKFKNEAERIEWIRHLRTYETKRKLIYQIISE